MLGILEMAPCFACWLGIQVALDAERAKRKVGRTYLGDLEKSALGKGKMQAVSLHNKSLMTGGCPCLAGPAGGMSTARVQVLASRLAQVEPMRGRGCFAPQRFGLCITTLTLPCDSLQHTPRS